MEPTNLLAPVYFLVALMTFFFHAAATAVGAVDRCAGLVVAEGAGLVRERAPVVRTDALIARLSAGRA